MPDALPYNPSGRCFSILQAVLRGSKGGFASSNNMLPISAFIGGY
jgi:hypothetical protein